MRLSFGFILLFILFRNLSIAQKDTSIYINFLHRGFSLHSNFSNGSWFEEEENIIYFNVSKDFKAVSILALRSKDKKLAYRGFLVRDTVISKTIKIGSPSGDYSEKQNIFSFIFKKDGWWDYFKNGKLTKRIFFVEDQIFKEVKVKPNH